MSVARWLETDTHANKDISTAVSIGTFTADADRVILVQVFADQVVGDDDYTFYMTHQVGGSGSHYRYIPITNAAASSGLTAIAAQSGAIAVRSGDVLTVYINGSTGDTSAPDIMVRWFEMATLQPTTPGRTLAADASGYVTANNALDAAGVRSALGLASANMDTQLDALPTSAEIALAVLAGTYEGSETVQQALRLFRAVLVGKSSGDGAVYRDAADSKARVTATLDSNGNRTAVAVDAS